MPPREKWRRLEIQKDHETPLTIEHMASCMRCARQGLYNVEHGMAKEEDILNLAVASNISLVLAENGLGGEHLPAIKNAQLHIVRLQRILNEGGIPALSLPGIQALRFLLDLHEAQVTEGQTTKLELKRAMRIIHERMVSGNYTIPEEA